MSCWFGLFRESQLRTGTPKEYSDQDVFYVKGEALNSDRILQDMDARTGAKTINTRYQSTGGISWRKMICLTLKA